MQTAGIDMTLKQVGAKTYYLENETNIGIFLTGPGRVCLIDTGSAGDGEKMVIQRKIMQEAFDC